VAALLPQQEMFGDSVDTQQQTLNPTRTQEGPLPIHESQRWSSDWEHCHSLISEIGFRFLVDFVRETFRKGYI